MANDQLIDTVISPQAYEQVQNLDKLLSELDIQMSTNIKTANQLNIAVLNAKSFKEYSATTLQAQTALEKLQQAQNKTAETALKLEATRKQIAEAEAQRAAKADQIRQQQAQKQAAQDAADIAAAEKKAAKLKAIQDESGFPPTQPQGGYVTQEPDTPMPAYTGGDNVSAGLAAQTAAREADAVASQQQTEAYAALDAEYKANIELLNALRAEQAANASALKELDLASAGALEKQTLLTAEQIRLKTEIAGVTLELNRQTKEMLAAQGSMTELDASVLRLRTAYEQLSVQERESTEGHAMLAQLQKLDAENKALAVSTGNTSKEVGAYEKAIAKATSGTQLAATAVTVTTRMMVRMIAQFFLFSVVLQAAEWLYKYIAALEIFNPVANAAERAQKGLSEALASSDYQKGIENVEMLASDLDLVKQGMIDSDTAINKYNETLGKTFGYVDNINDAQKEFIKNKQAYIQTVIDEAAAQAIAADAAKEVADLAKKNQDMANYNEAHKNYTTPAGVKELEKIGDSQSDINLTRQQIRENEAEIKHNQDRMNEITNQAILAIDQIRSKNPNVNAKTGSDAIADELNKRANAELERQKEIAASKINNDKLSYAERIQAANDFYRLSVQIEDNNEKNALSKLKENDARRKDIAADGLTKLTELQIQHNETLQKLKDAAYKQDQEHLKNSLEAQRDVFKAILDDPNQSYSAKLAALKFYNDKSKELIDRAHKEAVTEAGKNNKAILLADDAAKKAENELAIQSANDRLKIMKDEYQKISEITKQGEQEQIETLDNASRKALEALDRAKNQRLDKLNQRHEAGKISESKYQKELFDINHAYNVAKISQEIATQKTILAIQEGSRDAAEAKMKADGIDPADIAKFVTDQNKPIQQTKDKISGLEINLQDENSKTPKGEKDAQKQLREEITKDTLEAIDAIDKARQAAYENEIARLEKQAQMIEENADNQKAIIQDSIVSEKTKAREIALLDKQVASQKRALQVQENAIKTKEAKADKEATIAKIIATGALAVVSALATSPAWLGIALAAITGATVAVELATAIAAPLPKYAKGGKWQPGLGLWGEAGMERANLPDGSVRYSDGPEITSFPIGTTITPHMDLMQQIKPNPVSGYVGGEQVGWGEILKYMKKRDDRPTKTVIKVNVDGSYEHYKRNYLTR